MKRKSEDGEVEPSKGNDNHSKVGSQLTEEETIVASADVV